MDRPSTLSAVFVRQIKKPGRYGDGRGGHGLSLLVKPMANGRISKTWSVRTKVNGRHVSIGLGSYPLVALAEAREKALAVRRELAKGRDPRASKAVTFEQAAEKTIALHADGWRNPRTADHWRSTFRRFVFPIIGTKPVADVTAGDVLQIVEPLWQTTHEQARKTLGRIAAVLRWAVAQGLRSDDPTSAVTAALPKNGHTVQHHKALPASDVGEAIAAVAASDAHWSTAACFEFIALTGVRSGEARLATWDEIDLDGALWEIPATRTKTSKPQRVPLSTRAVEVLRDAHDRTGGGTGLVFPSATGVAMSDGTMSKLLRELGVDGTVHGLRSSLRSWLAEQAVPRDLAESVLGHAVAGVEGAYQRSDLLHRRREVLEAWSAYVNP